MENKDIICWWSGGITSAVACKIAKELYGDRCRFIMIDTYNEDEDTYRFKRDCENWFQSEIESITAIGKEHESIEDVWEKYLSLNVATGAICSTQLKRIVREKWQKENEYTSQVFGFEFGAKEFNRALSMAKNHPKSKPIFPLLMKGYDKSYCISVVESANIEIPRMYKLGFKNNNCFKTGCVQGGIGYWQKMRIDFPDKFDRMAVREHIYTNMKGSPVTMLKDQSNDGKRNIELYGKSGNLVFLKKHFDYPYIKCIDDMPMCKVEPLFECNGFCGINDLAERSETEKQINYGGIFSELED